MHINAGMYLRARTHTNTHTHTHTLSLTHTHTKMRFIARAMRGDPTLAVYMHGIKQDDCMCTFALEMW